MLNDDYPITDGWVAQAMLRCDLSFVANVLPEFDDLRRAENLRSKMWTVPEDSSQILIPAYGSYEYQISCKPGSIIWGYLFTLPSDQGIGPYSFQARESCTGVPLFSEPVVANQLLGGTFPNVLTRPWVIPEPGLITVEICNLGATAVNQVQLILCGGEPVDPQCTKGRTE